MAGPLRAGRRQVARPDARKPPGRPLQSPLRRRVRRRRHRGGCRRARLRQAHGRPLRRCRHGGQSGPRGRAGTSVPPHARGRRREARPRHRGCPGGARRGRHRAMRRRWHAPRRRSLRWFCRDRPGGSGAPGKAHGGGPAPQGPDPRSELRRAGAARPRARRHLPQGCAAGGRPRARLAIGCALLGHRRLGRRARSRLLGDGVARQRRRYRLRGESRLSRHRSRDAGDPALCRGDPRRGTVPLGAARGDADAARHRPEGRPPRRQLQGRHHPYRRHDGQRFGVRRGPGARRRGPRPELRGALRGRRDPLGQPPGQGQSPRHRHQWRRRGRAGRRPRRRSGPQPAATVGGNPRHPRRRSAGLLVPAKSARHPGRRAGHGLRDGGLRGAARREFRRRPGDADAAGRHRCGGRRRSGDRRPTRAGGQAGPRLLDGGKLGARGPRPAVEGRHPGLHHAGTGGGGLLLSRVASPRPPARPRDARAACRTRRPRPRGGADDPRRRPWRGARHALGYRVRRPCSGRSACR